MSFFDETGTNRLAGRLNSVDDKFLTWGRNQFASNFAQGGIAAHAFSPGGRRPWGSARHGGGRYIQRLEAMKAAAPHLSAKYDKMIGEARDAYGGRGYGRMVKDKKTGAMTYKGPGRLSKIGGVVMPAAGAAFLAMPAFGEGSVADKVTNITANAAAMVGWEVGTKVGRLAGAKTGAAIGTAILPGLGTAAGAVVGGVAGWLGGGLAGSIVGEESVHAWRSGLDHLATIGRRQRKWEGWYGDTSAFQTEKAVTMRQASLQMMNQGMMSARSGLGHEGIMVHR